MKDLLTIGPSNYLAKRKFKMPWKSLSKIGKGFGKIFGGGGDDDDNAYAMYKREETDEGE